jgi:hypothetical protein
LQGNGGGQAVGARADHYCIKIAFGHRVLPAGRGQMIRSRNTPAFFSGFPGRPNGKRAVGCELFVVWLLLHA